MNIISQSLEARVFAEQNRPKAHLQEKAYKAAQATLLPMKREIQKVFSQEAFMEDPSLKIAMAFLKNPATGTAWDLPTALAAAELINAEKGVSARVVTASDSESSFYLAVGENEEAIRGLPNARSKTISRQMTLTAIPAKQGE
jgi:hypothetical protein